MLTVLSRKPAETIIASGSGLDIPDIAGLEEALLTDRYGSGPHPLCRARPGI